MDNNVIFINEEDYYVELEKGATFPKCQCFNGNIVIKGTVFKTGIALSVTGEGPITEEAITNMANRVARAAERLCELNPGDHFIFDGPHGLVVGTILVEPHEF